jgi:tetratricopeptide (TPR) repeat protein
MPRATSRLLLILSLALAAPSMLRGDTIWWGSGEGRGVAAQGRILRFDAASDQLVYESGGREITRKLELVKQLVVDGEAAFNSAEEQFLAQQFDKAVEGYQRTLRSTTREWLRTFAAIRLATAASKAGRFDAAVSAYVALVRIDPSLAARNKPQLPPGRSTFLDTAAQDLAAARGQVNSNAARQAILSLLLEVHQARQDTPAANAVLEDLLKLDIGAADNPVARLALANIRLSQARQALDANDPARAREAIEGDRTLFNDPAQQAEALFLLAESLHASAGEDRAALQDAAIAYMRVVAHFKDADGRPRVADALMKVAAIHETLGGADRAAAVAVYRQVASEFASEPAGAAAKQALQRMEGDPG